jgi:YesN/AraC family two-component response regulator
MTIKRILFVDDEPNVLRAMKLSMRRHAKQWDMVFVGGGEEALAELRKAPFDLVITDMRMPKVDGADLLAVVATEWPTAKRVILSGYADDDSLARGMKYAHKWLTKPCAQQTLIEAIAELEAPTAAGSKMIHPG